MKILHVGYSDLLGGAAISMSRLHEAMCNNGINSEVLVLRKLGNNPKVIGSKNKFEIFLKKIKIKI